jgi:murein DD-endopeptidase MepM/ murein hydrolase activator NlpD
LASGPNSHPVPGLVSGPARVRALQLLCCAAVAWAGLVADASVDPRLHFAEAAFEMIRPAMQPASPANIGAAMQVAGAGLSRIEVIVRRNETMDQVFRRLELSMQDLAALRAMRGLKSMIDRLQPGELLTVKHRDGELIGLERRLSPSETLRVEREKGSGFVANVEEVPLTRTPVTVHGVVRSSLFAATAESGLRGNTARALADIFGWDIDFAQDLRPGDEFTVTYEKLMRDGEYVRDGDVLAARFVNQGRRFEAVRFMGVDGKPGYFTPEGRSLRKAFLKAPLEFTSISTGFGTAEMHPILNLMRIHKGIDYRAPTGTPVRAIGDGKVFYRGNKGGYGNVLEIQHGGGIITRYGHLSRFEGEPRAGDPIRQGDVIGYVGMTGLATGPHLHFEFLVRGQQKNPQSVIKASESPQLDIALQVEFDRQTAPLLASLSGAPLPRPTIAPPSLRPVAGRSPVAAR